MQLSGKKVLVMGLGRFGGGIGVSQWLVSQGALVTVTDMAKPEDLAQSLSALAGLPITFKLAAHDLADFTSTDLLVINPAVDKAQSPFVQAALKANIPATTEMNLFLQRCPAPVVGITGSVGKSTTTALIHEALTAALHPPTKTIANPPTRIFLGGNIGKSLLADLPTIRPTDIVVLELSSFMLEETAQLQWSPHMAVVTNVFPNHLDRHGTMASYTAAKQNILRFQKPTDVAILNNDHDLVSRWVHLAKGKVVKFTTRGPGHRFNMNMPGEHNQSNAAAALAVVDALMVEGMGLNRAAAVAAIEEFGGLPHRLQWVHSFDIPAGGAGAAARRIRFFNDSKATSPDASTTAVRAFPEGTAIFIVGGYDKHLEAPAFEEFFSLLAHNAAAVLAIGQTGRAFLEAIGARGTAAKLEYAQTLPAAVAAAKRLAAQIPAVQSVVLSPASASWDQFANYEAHGDLFTQLSKNMP